MKKFSSIKLLLVVIIVATFSVAKASLPPLKEILPPVTLPHVFNNSSPLGLIDVDGNGTPDYEVYFQFSTTSSSFCYIQQYSSGGNQMLVEYVNPPESPLASKPLLSVTNHSTPYSALLDNGAIISGGTGNWYSWSYLCYREHPTAPLGSNFTSPKYSGYIGVHYFTGPSDLVGYYGWLWADIDPSLTSVTIGSSGHSESPGSSILAGTSSAVPIPLIASILGFGLVGGGIFLKRRKKK